PLEDRSEQRVVTGDNWGMALLFTDLVSDPSDHRNIDEAVGRVGRRLHEDHRDTALGHGLPGGSLHRCLTDAICKAYSRNAQIEERLGQKRLRAAIEWLRMQYGIARAHESKQRRCDCRHTRGKQRAAFRPLVNGQTVLDDLAVGMVEA